MGVRSAKSQNVGQSQDIEHRVSPTPSSELSRLLSLTLSPVRLVLTGVSRSSRLWRPIAPQFIPLFVCLLLLPLLGFLSLYAGWVVWRSVAVGWKADLYLQYGDGVPPYAEVLLPPLVSQQHYDISLDLIVPATDANFALGNFMTSLTLSTPANRTLTSIRRPTIAFPPSRRHFTFWSSSPVSITLRIPLLYSFAPGTTQVVAKVELGRRDNWRSIGAGEGRELSVLSASLEGSVRHHGVRGLVTRLPFTFAILSAMAFLVISLVTVIACLIPAVNWGGHHDNPRVRAERFVKLEPSKDASSGDSDEDKPLQRRKSKGKGTRNRFTKGIKSEEASSSILPPDESSEPAPLRRRRSRLTEQTAEE